MPFDDLPNEKEENESDPGDDALDELAGTLSGETGVTSSTDDYSEDQESKEPEYDPKKEPAFPTIRQKTQHSIYCLPETWDHIDGASGLLFEAEIKLRRDGYDSVQKRELHNALLQAAANHLTEKDIQEAFVQTRMRRESGELIEE